MRKLAHALLCAGVPCINETLRFLECSNAYVLPMILLRTYRIRLVLLAILRSVSSDALQLLKAFSDASTTVTL